VIAFLSGIVVSMKFKAEIENSIVVLSVSSIVSDVDLEEFKVWVESVKSVVHELYDKIGGPIPILVDVSELKEYRPEAFELLAKLLKHDEPLTSKIALLGTTSFLNSSKDALSAYANVKTPMESFTSIEEALAWLSN